MWHFSRWPLCNVVFHGRFMTYTVAQSIRPVSSPICLSSQARVLVTCLATAFDDRGNVRCASLRCHVMQRQHSGQLDLTLT